MPLILFQRSVSNGSPNDTVVTFSFDPATDLTTIVGPTSVPHGSTGAMLPAVGTLIYEHCSGPDFIRYTTKLVSNTFNSSALFYLNKVVTSNSPICCDLSAADFDAIRTNNTSPTTPNGTIVVTAPVLTIADYEASIDGGATWVPAVAGAITFTGLPAATYTVNMRDVSGPCAAFFTVVISDSITYPPLLISESVSDTPALYSPVFYPIKLGFTLDNATGTVKHDVNGTYLEVPTTDGRDYLGTLPIIRILDSIYAGKYQILSVDNDTTPTKFYIDAVYVSDQAINFVPFDRQVFQLFAEKDLNNFIKIADIAIYANATGEYVLRLEGFLQSVFKIMQPINYGDEITLLRKYYVMPRDFDMLASPTVLNAVYSGVRDLTNFLGPLIPLGPVPINFINEQTSKGLPVLFSYIDTTVGRVKNITSSDQTSVVSTGPVVYIPGLLLNVYDVTWINPLGAIGSLNVTPALPDWITLEPSAADTVKLSIDTGAGTSVGDYDELDYDSDDYLTAGNSALVGCYTYTFKDGATVLFELTVCIFPIQSFTRECSDGFNIAWINREGGWSSYVFGGTKTYGKDIGDVATYKSGNQLRRQSVDNVYDTAEVTIAAKNILDLQFIASLKQSIQAYLYSENTLQWSIPIILDKQSFNIYTTPFKQIEVRDGLKFKYAEEIIIQSQ